MKITIIFLYCDKLQNNKQQCANLGCFISLAQSIEEMIVQSPLVMSANSSWLFQIAQVLSVYLHSVDNSFFITDKINISPGHFSL